MRSFIISLLLGISFAIAQDAAGNYKLSGVDVMYTYITRDSVVLTVTDAYGLGVTQKVKTIPAAVPCATPPPISNLSVPSSIPIRKSAALPSKLR